MIVPTEVAGTFSTKKGVTLGAFAHYMLCEGQQQASALGYSPLPLNLVQAGFKQISRIPGAGNAANVDISKCNNPTFKPGDKPGNNLLAKTAPMPQACDKQGATQCATGAANSSGGSSGSGSSGSNGATGTPGEDTNGGGGSGSVYVGPTANGKAQLEAYAYELPKTSWGPDQTWMVVAALLTIFAVVIPPLAIRWLENRNTKGSK
jgi:phosphate transport system substrate-binding protein